MKVLALMQNMWLRDPERVKALLERHTDPEVRANSRRRLIKYALFAGCLSGRRLQQAFGKDVCDSIVWDEASPEITSSPNACPPADPAHIQSVIDRVRPDVVLCFGRIATEAVKTIWPGALISAPHPAARQPDTVDRLRVAANELATLKGEKR